MKTGRMILVAAVAILSIVRWADRCSKAEKKD